MTDSRTPPVLAQDQDEVPQQIHDIGRRRAWVIWAIAVSVYVLAVFHRSSLGVAGLLAAHRFDIAATQLATFTVLQLVVYAGMQVPVGVLLDRFGPKRLLLAGLVLMTSAQMMFAFVDSFGAAVLARGLVGAGDAMVFVTVVRVVNTWFKPGQIPMLTQMTGWAGQLGAIVAATPLTLMLTHFGWTRTFALTSSIGLLVMLAVVLVVKDSPFAGRRRIELSLGELARSVRTVWANPGTRLGFWVHFVTQCSFTVFALLWGVPFLVRGQGWSEVAAGTVLIAMTGWVVVSGAAIGAVSSRRPFIRSQVALGVVAAQALTWTAVLALDGPAPTWLLVLLFAAVASGGPASVIGFDLARTFNEDAAIGRATGLVNVGGFVASLVTIWVIGVLLDVVEPAGTSAYVLDDFRIAFLAQVPVWVLGTVMVLRLRPRAVAHLDAHHPGAVEALRSGEIWTPRT